MDRRRGRGVWRHGGGLHDTGSAGSAAPWASGLIAIGPELPADLPKIGRLTPVRLRLLPGLDRTELILNVMRQVAQDKAIGLEKQLRPKLIMVAFDRAEIDTGSLQSGRLAQAGSDEVIAGPRAPGTINFKSATGCSRWSATSSPTPLSSAVRTFFPLPRRRKACCRRASRQFIPRRSCR